MFQIDPRRPERWAQTYLLIERFLYRLTFQDQKVIFQKEVADQSCYEVSFSPGENPWCTCPAFYSQPPCKHVLALASLQQSLQRCHHPETLKTALLF